MLRTGFEPMSTDRESVIHSQLLYVDRARRPEPKDIFAIMNS